MHVNAPSQNTIITPSVKPGSYFLPMRMPSEFDVKLTSHPPFAAIIRKGEQQSSTSANCSLRIGDVKIRFAFSIAGSMNRASLDYSIF